MRNMKIEVQGEGTSPLTVAASADASYNLWLYDEDGGDVTTVGGTATAAFYDGNGRQNTKVATHTVTLDPTYNGHATLVFTDDDALWTSVSIGSQYWFAVTLTESGGEVSTTINRASINVV